MSRSLVVGALLVTACTVQVGAEEVAPAKALVAGAAAVTAPVTDAELGAVSQRVSTVLSSYGNTTLATGLSELAKREPRYAIAVATANGKGATGGVAHYSLGSNDMGMAAKNLYSGIAGKRYPSAPGSVTWQLSNQDMGGGQYVEQWTGTLTIQAQNLQPTTWRRFGPPVPGAGQPNAFPGGNVTPAPNGSAIAGGGPMLVPEVSMQEVRTTVAVPLGGGAMDAWDREIAAINARPDAGNPEIAWQLYRTGMERVEQTWPKATVVWATMPLSSTLNARRNHFNARVRAYATEHAKPLLDVAAIQSTAETGQTYTDTQGECSNPAWMTPGGMSQMNVEGSVRMAKAWWWLQAHLSNAITADVTPAPSK